MWCQFYHKGEGERIISCVSYSRYVTSLPHLGQERCPKGGEVELYSIITAESPVQAVRQSLLPQEKVPSLRGG